MIANISHPTTLTNRYTGILLVAAAVNVFVGTAPASALAVKHYERGPDGRCYYTTYVPWQAVLPGLNFGIPGASVNPIYWKSAPSSMCKQYKPLTNPSMLIPIFPSEGRGRSQHNDLPRQNR